MTTPINSTSTSRQSFTSGSSNTSSPPPLPPSSPKQLELEPEQIPPLHYAAQINDLSFLDSHSSQFDVNLQDSQGITALHWASINGHLLFCSKLLQLGAKVDVRGGELQGTPLMWASRNGHLSIVHLLLKQGSADPNLKDLQSFNSLHLSIHSSNPFLVCYFLNTLQPNLTVDSTDEQGHTGLQWASYQGDAISVELLLKSGASVKKVDQQGLSSLHWAVTKGNSSCIKTLIEKGSDLNLKDYVGNKTAKDLSKELKNFESFKRALLDLEKDENGKLFDKPIKDEKTLQKAIFLGLIFSMGLCFKTFEWILKSFDSGWLGTLILMFECYGIHYTVTKVLLGVKTPIQSDKITKSNYLMSIISASLFWVTWVWLTRDLFTETKGYGLTNFLFGISLFICCYNFWRSITLNPGHVPFSPNDIHLKDTIESLVEDGRFNGMNFCLTCLVKRPLRSKHSYATGRCVGRFDHYCPWVWNDIGVNNHRQFLLFVSSLVIGVLLFIRLRIAYFTQLPESESTNCSLLPTPLCQSLLSDPFAYLVTLWSSLQLSWTVILLGVQIWQVCKQVTTLEVSNLGKFGYMGGKPGISAPNQQGAVAKFQAAQQAQQQSNSQISEDLGSTTNEESSSLARAPSRTSMKPSGAFGFLLKLLGLDRFTSTSKALLHTHTHAHSHSHTHGDHGVRVNEVGGGENPFDLGIVSNCLDFWTKSEKGGLKVDWTDPESISELPKGGFKQQQQQRLARRGPGSGSPYERVQLEEV